MSRAPPWPSLLAGNWRFDFRWRQILSNAVNVRHRIVGSFLVIARDGAHWMHRLKPFGCGGGSDRTLATPEGFGRGSFGCGGGCDRTLATPEGFGNLHHRPDATMIVDRAL
jgi:hypothetical protein